MPSTLPAAPAASIRHAALLVATALVALFAVTSTASAAAPDPNFISAIGTNPGPAITAGVTLTVDSAGNTYVADSDNRIIVMNPAGQRIHMFGTPVYPGRSSALAVAPDGTLWITDRAWARIYHVDLDGNLLQQFNASDGQFTAPQGIAIDQSGNIYFSEPDKGRVTEMDQNGTILAHWGAAGQFSSLQGIAIDPDGSHIYTADQGFSRIQKMDRSGNILWTAGTQGNNPGQLLQIQSIALGSDGSIYTDEYGTNHRIQKWDANGHYVSGNNNVGNTPLAVATGPGGKVEVLDQSTGSVGRYDSNLVKIDTIGEARRLNQQELWSPFDVDTDAAGNMVVGDQNRHGFYRFKADGTFISYTAFNPTQAVAVNPDGSFWVGGSGTIGHFDANGNRIGTITSSTDDATRFTAVLGLDNGPGGSIYVSSFGHVIQFAADGTVLKVFGDRMFGSIGGLTVAPNGDIFVVDTSTGQISRFDSNGNLLNKFGSSGTGQGQLNFAHGIAFDSDGNLLVADSTNHRVLRFTPSGGYLGTFGTPGYFGAFMQNPYGVEQAPNGDILVADFTHGVVSRWNGASGLSPTSTALASSGASTYGDSVTFTATVTGASAGTVAFQEKVGSDWVTVGGCGGVALGGLTGSTATCSTNALGAGTHTVRAAFKGSGVSPSTSSSVDQQVAKALVHIDAGAVAKTYGDTAPAAAGTLRSADLKNSDTLATAGITGAPACSTDDARDAGVHSGAATCAAGDLAAANYSFAPGNAADLTVAKAQLHVDADAATATYGDADPAPTGHIRASDLKYDDGADVATGDAACTIAGHDAGAATYAGAITCAPGTLTASNYTFAAGDAADLAIGRAPLTVTADDAAMTYGDELPHFTAQFDGLKNGDDAGDVHFDVDGTDAGDHVITPSGVASGNYNVTYTVGTLVVAKAPLTVTANDAGATYGDAVPAFSAGYDGFVNGDDAGDLDGTLALTSDAGDHPDAGHYAITASGLDARNYAIAYEPGTLTVDRAPLTVTADDASTTYGDDLPAFTAQFDGLKNGDDAGDVQFDVDGRDAGDHAITPKGLDAPNYDITYKAGKLTVAKRALTAAADDATRAYGQDNPNLTGTLTGAVDSDHIGVTYATDAAKRSDVGDYAISAHVDDPDGRLGNYDVTTKDGNLTVTKAALHANADDATQVYGGTPAELTGSLDGLVDGDNVTATWAADGTDAGDHAIGATLDDPDGRLANYTVDYSGTLTITRAPLTVSGAGQSRTYGDDNPALTGKFDGLVPGDDVTATWSTDATPRSDVGDYATHADLGGAALHNYTPVIVAGKLTVTKRPLSAVANDVTRPYGEDNPTLGGKLTGVASGDDVTAKYTTAATKTSKPGHYSIDASVIGADAVLANYAITTHAGDLTVIDTHGPTLVVPGPIKAEATGTDGAKVNYTVTATDDTVDNPPVTCTPASGSTFAIGTTTVTCQATDGVNVTTDSFTVTVADTTAPVLTLPANTTVDATDSNGAVVNYTATAKDAIEGSVPVTCTPASGTKFAVGTTTVTCTASDSRGNTSRGTFTITVNGAGGQLDNLIRWIDQSNLPAPVKAILKSQIVYIERYIASGKLHQQCQSIDATINYLVSAQRNHQIPSQLADPMLQVLRQVRVIAAC